MPSIRLVVLESGLGLESGLESISAELGLGLELGLDLKGLGLGLETPGLGLVLGLGSFSCKSFFKSTCNLTMNSRNSVHSQPASIPGDFLDEVCLRAR